MYRKAILSGLITGIILSAIPVCAAQPKNFQYACNRTDETIFIKEKRSSDAANLAVLEPDAICRILENGTKWTKVFSGGFTGFVRTDDLSTEILKQDAEDGVVFEQNAAIYEYPNSGSKPISARNRGASEKITGNENKNWIEVEFIGLDGSNLSGWVKKENITEARIVKDAEPYYTVVKEETKQDEDRDVIQATHAEDEAVPDTQKEEQGETQREDESDYTLSGMNPMDQEMHEPEPVPQNETVETETAPETQQPGSTVTGTIPEPTQEPENTELQQSDIEINIVQATEQSNQASENITLTDEVNVTEAISETPENSIEKPENDQEEITPDFQTEAPPAEESSTPVTQAVPEETSEKTEEEPKDTAWHGEKLNKHAGTVMGPSGKETYYNLPMDNIISGVQEGGWIYKTVKDEYKKNLAGKYWVREDGVKMLGDYVIVAANLSTHPRGSLVETSLGQGIVLDTGGFATDTRNPYRSSQIDLAAQW